MKNSRNSILVLTVLVSSIAFAQDYPFQVSIKGKGQPILLLPGFACTGAVWDETVAALSKDYECHIFTFAGFGDVPAVELPWLPKIKSGLSQYVKDKELENPIIIGHSLGGTLALCLATEASNPFEQIIVVDGLPASGALMIPNFNSDEIIYDTPYNKQMVEMKEESFKFMAQQMAQGMMLNTDKKALVTNWMLQADRETYVYGYTDLLKLDLREDLASISIPVTILAATSPYGKEMAKLTYNNQFSKLSNYTIHFAENAAHFIMYDQPEWFMKNLNNILQN